MYGNALAYPLDGTKSELRVSLSPSTAVGSYANSELSSELVFHVSVNVIPMHACGEERLCMKL